jgi:hypothetical protein
MQPPHFDLHEDKIVQDLEKSLPVKKCEKNWKKLQDCWELQMDKWIKPNLKEESALIGKSSFHCEHV